ncbi:MAG: class I SAM-dependent methyltransferase [Mycolicibacterium vanbaalenii]|uniref:Class I SAM-dependent methyltransferase n=1 Tax=Mycolicibacterium frederiksbergense TaxID=117567 RepID=A0A6H0RWD1_9MYCO|nr:class I SAM-dependent methyltransferase [Mycolicibacterium frederiksbergense]QIV79523.1 class I SAM-dependent methyltransferase [Mycolicibacterium frederiksbergense]
MDLSTFQHPRFARMYERISAESEERGTAERRDHALAGLSGRVIEVGAGNGLNFGHYPPTVAEVVAVEPDDHLRGLAAQAAESAPVPVQVLAGHATALPVEDGGFDAVVASLVLCSVPDQRAALAEMRRVLKPDGQLRFFEHVRSQTPWLGLLEDAITPLWSRIGGGCHPNRDTTAAIRAAGFDIETLDRFSYAPLRHFPRFAHILGQARPKPGLGPDV